MNRSPSSGPCIRRRTRSPQPHLAYVDDACVRRNASVSLPPFGWAKARARWDCISAVRPLPWGGRSWFPEAEGCADLGLFPKLASVPSHLNRLQGAAAPQIQLARRASRVESCTSSVAPSRVTVRGRWSTTSTSKPSGRPGTRSWAKNIARRWLVVRWVNTADGA